MSNNIEPTPSFVIDSTLTFKKYPYLIPKCTLHFRPRGDNWKNEPFGFDWIRIGDCGAWCDTDGWRNAPKPDWFLANLMGKYYETGTSNICDELNGWTTMINGSACNFVKEISLYNKLLQESFPIRFQQKNEILSSSLGPVSDDIENAIEKSFRMYYVPIMFLRETITANLKVMIRVDSSALLPKRIEITHTPASGGTSPFSIANGVISSVSTGLNSNNISITCNSTFSDFQTIDAHAIYDVDGREEKALCGQLRVHPNDVIRTVNLLHIKVKLNIGGSTTTGRNLGSSELSKLRRIFNNQALIDCHFPESTHELTIRNEIYGEIFSNTKTDTRVELLSSLAVPPVPGVTNQPPIVTETHASVTTEAVTINKQIVGQNLITTITTTTTTQQRFKLTGNTNVAHDWLISNGSGGYVVKDKAGFNDLVLMAFKKYLKDRAAITTIGSLERDIDRYDNFIKIFTFNNDQRIASGVTTERNHTITLFTRYTDETCAHEVGHALGLAHPFVASEQDSRARFTYEAKKTDNIMDYSHHDSKDRYSLFYWQMQVMWQYIDSLNSVSTVIPQQQSNEQEYSVTIKIPDIKKILKNEIIPIFKSVIKI